MQQEQEKKAVLFCKILFYDIVSIDLSSSQNLKYVRKTIFFIENFENGSRSEVS